MRKINEEFMTMCVQASRQGFLSVEVIGETVSIWCRYSHTNKESVNLQKNMRLTDIYIDEMGNIFGELHHTEATVTVEYENFYIPEIQHLLEELEDELRGISVATDDMFENLSRIASVYQTDATCAIMRSYMAEFHRCKWMGKKGWVKDGGAE